MTVSIRRVVATTLLGGVLATLAVPRVAAVQVHGRPEGLVVHQLGHLAFLLAMGYLIARLSTSGRLGEPGWRSVGVAAAFFALWNLDTIAVHAIVATTDPPWLGAAALIEGGPVALDGVLEWMGYLGRYDSVLIVASMAWFTLGLHRIRIGEEPYEGGDGT